MGDPVKILLSGNYGVFLCVWRSFSFGFRHDGSGKKKKKESLIVRNNPAAIGGKGAKAQLP